MADLKLPKAKLSDIFLVLFVLAIALMLFIPLPTFTLDFLLTANIAFAFLLLLVGLYMPNSLALLAFPSLLLLTTLFRLALNVASTRLILSQGEAGRVIEAFGTFLISGEILVGIVIFTIITIVNLLVIAKGTGRVSEVAARFALDALPGKQLAIDADLRAGLIDANMAQEKRENLRKESQLYGAMDGSMKFVQNDAIAGVVIIFTNILGGMYQGLAKGLTFGEASEIYTTLTIGDGLVSQIPALLISICAGIVVTRVSSNNKSTLGSDVSKQVFQNPYLLSATAVLLAALGLISNLPVLPFAIICSVLFLTSILMYRKNQTNILNNTSSGKLLLESEQNSSLLLESGSNKLVCNFSSDLYANYKKSIHSIHESWLFCSTDFSSTYGLDLPDISVVNSQSLTNESVEVFFENQKILSLDVPVNSTALLIHDWQVELLGIEIKFREQIPNTNINIIWVDESQSNSQIIEALEVDTLSFFDYISICIKEFFIKYPEEVFTASYINSKIRELDSSLSLELLRPERISQVKLSEVIQKLIKNKIPVRNFKSILESVASYCDLYPDLEVINNDDLYLFIAKRYSKHLLKNLNVEDKLSVFLLNSETEELFSKANLFGLEQEFTGNPDLIEAIEYRLKSLGEVNTDYSLVNITILCRKELKSKVKSFCRLKSYVFEVLSYDELTKNLNLYCLKQI